VKIFVKPWAKRLGKNIAIGGAAGYATGRIVSDSMGAEHAGKKGLKVGATVGALATIPTARVKQAGAKLASSAHAAIKSQGGYGVVFRRIRGRVIPVRVK
jgi:hypothetical protein